MNNRQHYTLKVLPLNIELRVSSGSNLWQSLIANNIDIQSSCGGTGTCGRCRVKVLKGDVACRDNKIISREENGSGIVLACLSTISSDSEISIVARPEKRIKIEGDKFSYRKNAFYTEASAVELIKKRFDPWLLRKKIIVEKPSLFYSTSDLFRFRKAVKEQAGISNIIVPLNILKKLPGILRENSWEVWVSADKLSKRVAGIQGKKGRERIFGFAVDIGTTTVVVYLVDLSDGRIVSSGADYNPQIKYGEDIINRIVYSLKDEGLKNLQKVITGKINEIASNLLREAKIENNEIAALTVSGNPTMIHLFMGVSPRFIREEPYITVANHFDYLRAAETGLCSFENAYVYTTGGIASYLGGDITSGLLAINILKKKKTSLFIDLGTNGELVVGNKDWLIGCSCSAGPAFEGGGVACGVRAEVGAIEKVTIDSDTLRCNFDVIGGSKPVGICGSGLIDLLGEMYLKGVIDRKGKFNKDIGNRYLEKTDDEYRYIIAEMNRSGSESNIYISEIDINNLMRAKAAVYSGIKTLLEEVDLKITDIDSVFIAGGLGKNLNVKNAIVIGMLPDISVEKYSFLGNTSVIGAYLSLVSEKKYRMAEKIADKVTYVELSVNMKFMDRYIAGLFLPYTDLKEFPTVEKLLFTD
jgi:uncharacterized 2Fe-2S/4Fe-4S cluster protein (DUF4445 family)